MATGENVLWIVKRVRLELGTLDKRDSKLFVFRTRKRAREFQNERDRRSKVYVYLEPERATWGPAN